MTIPELISIPIIEALPDITSDQFDFIGTYTDKDGELHAVKVFDTEYFIQNVINLFRYRMITLPAAAPAQELINLFRIWKKSRENLYFKQAYAYTLKYNPIENYSSVEKMRDDITTHEHGSGTRTEYDDYKEKTETTPYTKEETTETPFTKVTNETTPYDRLTVETTPYDDETTVTSQIDGSNPPPNNESKSSIMAFNSSNWVDVSKSESKLNSKEQITRGGTEKVDTTWDGTEKTETTWAGTHKNTLVKTGTEKHERTYEGTKDEVTHGTDTDRHQYDLTKSGNIGVQTAAEMLQKEYEGLIQDLAYRALTEFIDRYTYYSVEID